MNDTVVAFFYLLFLILNFTAAVAEDNKKGKKSILGHGDKFLK